MIQVHIAPKTAPEAPFHDYIGESGDVPRVGDTISINRDDYKVTDVIWSFAPGGFQAPPTRVTVVVERSPVD
ncbi:hypothetical protein GCM10010199_23780 [Dactylosporangium roseum]